MAEERFRPSAPAFFQIAINHWKQLQALPKPHVPKVKPGETEFVPIVSLIRGQDEVSVDNIWAKLQKRIAEGDVTQAHHQWVLNHNHGKSSAPKDDPIEVVRGPEGYVVVDGHHDLYLALYLGAETIPVQVREDFSDLPPRDFWKKLEDSQLTLLTDTPETLAKSPPRMEDVRDNPNRYLASLLALKVKAKIRHDDVEISKATGSETPVWIKVNDSEPFVEFRIARALSDAGIKYQSSWGEKVPPEIVKKSRVALLKAQSRPAYRLSRIPILTEQEASKSGNLNEVSLIVRRSLAEKGGAHCAGAFD